MEQHYVLSGLQEVGSCRVLCPVLAGRLRRGPWAWCPSPVGAQDRRDVGRGCRSGVLTAPVHFLPKSFRGIRRTRGGFPRASLRGPSKIPAGTSTAAPHPPARDALCFVAAGAVGGRPPGRGPFCYCESRLLQATPGAVPPFTFSTTMEPPEASPESARRRYQGEGKVGLSFVRPEMPLFGNIFSPKKTPPRKSASLSNLRSLDRSTREVELGLDYGTPTMNLAGQSLKFENGQWITETGISGGVDRREAQRLRRRNQQLEEENNLLRLKVDILLDMLSETTAESHLMEKELDELKSISRRRK